MMRAFCNAAAQRLGVVALALAAMAGMSAVVADSDDERDHEKARGAYERGEVRSLSEIIDRVSSQVDGEIVEAEFEREHGRWIYELKIIERSGRLLELYVDAETAEIIKVEED